jgi:hypothetical protein
MMYRHLYAHNSGLLDDDYINQLKRGEAVAKAATVLRPSLNAAATIHHVSKSDFGELDLESLFNSLSDQVEQVNQGNLERLEALLVAQAHTLDAIFNSLVRRAASNWGSTLMRQISTCG